VLGASFPPFSLVATEKDIEIHVESDLDAAALARLKAAAEALDEPVAITILFPSKPAQSLSFYRRASGDLMLLPALSLAPEVPRAVRWLAEEDEEFWLSQREEALLGGKGLAGSAMFPHSWDRKEFRCVVDATVFPAANIRSYLTLFDTIFLGLPLGDKFAEALKHLGATRSELVQLVGSGRVKILLPHSIERYDLRWLAEALEAKPDGLVSSRRIACGVLADTRRRLPFIHPNLDLAERRILMTAMQAAANDVEVPEDLRTHFQVVAKECASIWNFAAIAIQRDGATQSDRVGVGWLASQLFEKFTGQERTLEIMSAARGMSWAAALDAHAFPNSTKDYSEDAACQMLAALSSPLGDREVMVADPRVHRMVDGLLAIDGDLPVLEFAAQFRGPDIERFRRILADTANWNQDDAFLDGEMKKFNAEVQQYERRPNRLRTMNVTSLVAAAGSEIAPHLSPNLQHSFHHVPIGIWLLGMVLARASEPAAQGAILGRFWDYTNGLLARTPPRAVLISRLRQQVRAIK
jgi:hypothetical protein